MKEKMNGMELEGLEKKAKKRKRRMMMMMT